MFQSQYGLSGTPFALTPDDRFFFSSAGHSRALSHLVYGLAQREGFIVVTGEVGAGKTTLMERVWSQLDRATFTMARVVTTQVTADDLLRLVASAFGLPIEQSDQASLLRQFAALLREEDAKGRRCLLIVDEVQSLPVPALEQLRMLSNLIEGGRAPLQTVLLGQPEFRARLASPELDQLRQRVLAAYHLGPLGAEETHGYIVHRLRTAGWAGNPAWAEAASAAVHRHTGGIPRRVNRLCSRILLYAGLESSAEVTDAIVDLTARELGDDLGGAAPADQPAAPERALLEARVAALEDLSARRERLFERLADVFGGVGASR